MTKSLILITNDFPACAGDYSFLRHEISALSKAFDSIQVFSYNQCEGEKAPLPKNTYYMGSLVRSPRTNIFKGLFRRGTIARAFRAFSAEKKLGRTPNLANILTGIRFAETIGIGERGNTVTSVYSFWATGGAVAVPFLGKAGKTIVRGHGYDLYEERNPHLPLRGPIFSSPNVIAPISAHGREYILDKYGAVIDPRLVKIARLGTEDYGEGPVPIEDEPIHVVSCSGLVALKRVPLICAVVAELAKKRKVIWTHLGGSGPALDSLREKAKEAVAALEGSLSIDLPGQVTNEEVASFYKETPISVFINASTTEGVPVSIMEAMSFGIPIVATDVGGTREIVTPEAGELVPENAAAAQIAEAAGKVADQRTHLRPRETWMELSNAQTNTCAFVPMLID